MKKIFLVLLIVSLIPLVTFAQEGPTSKAESELNVDKLLQALQTWEMNEKKVSSEKTEAPIEETIPIPEDSTSEKKVETDEIIISKVAQTTTESTPSEEITTDEVPKKIEEITPAAIAASESNLDVVVEEAPINAAPEEAQTTKLSEAAVAEATPELPENKAVVQDREFELPDTPEILYQITKSKFYELQHPFNVENGSYLAKRLDAYFKFFNQYFHFNENQITSPFKVKIFANKADFNLYLTGTTETDSDFVFIQYNDSDKNELIGYLSDDISNFYKRLQHYSFVQYFRYFVPNPPLWIEKGFSIYFGKSKYREERDKVYYKENLAWLNTLKDFINNNAQEKNLYNVLFATPEQVKENPPKFYAYSWGILNFLLNYPNANYNRIIWDSIKTIAGNPKDVNENTLKDIFSWVNANKFDQDFENYIASRNTFPELVEEGIRQYNRNELATAKEFFLKSITIEDENFIPYYYLGLVAYAEKDFSLAEFYYNSAIQLNGDKSLCNYALGINAYATKEYEKVKNYFAASLADTPRFKSKIDKILTIISSQQEILKRVK